METENVRRRLTARPSFATLTLLTVLAAANTAVASPGGSTYTVLYTFGNQQGDGVAPEIDVHDKFGNLYGRTYAGGTSNEGTIFKIAPNGSETVLYSFCSRKNCNDGAQPAQGLVIDRRGNVYGVDENGGTYGFGVVFEVTQAGTEKVLYSFTGGTDGAHPEGLLRDGSGNLYGTTINGGDMTACYSGCGVVYKLANGIETVLHDFEDSSDGAYPQSPLIMDAHGNLYGTTTDYGPRGDGTVFEIGTDGTETILHSFTNGSDGGQPISGLTMDASGNLYGVTFGGGQTGCYHDVGCGVAFKLAPDETFTTLHAFQGGSDGGNPEGTLIEDSKGNLYGVTDSAGNSGCDGNYGCGTIFKIAPGNKETVLYAFKGATDGGNPAAVIWDPAFQKGVLFGGAFSAGANGDGVAFSLTK